MAQVSEPRCRISDLPEVMCADCRHDTHGARGRGLPMGAYDGLDELVDTRVELGRSAPPDRVVVVEANIKSMCKWDDCVLAIKVGDRIGKHPDFPELGFVHAEHVE